MGQKCGRYLPVTTGSFLEVQFQSLVDRSAFIHDGPQRAQSGNLIVWSTGLPNWSSTYAEDESPLARQQSPHPIGSDTHLHGKCKESSVHCGHAERKQMDARLDDASDQEPWCEPVSDTGSVSGDSDEQEAAEYG